MDAIIRAYDGLELTMRTTVAIDDKLLERARELTDIKEVSALIREGLTLSLIHI